jgi:hypothetical protein
MVKAKLWQVPWHSRKQASEQDKNYPWAHRTLIFRRLKGARLGPGGHRAVNVAPSPIGRSLPKV